MGCDDSRGISARSCFHDYFRRGSLETRSRAVLRRNLIVFSGISQFQATLAADWLLLVQSTIESVLLLDSELFDYSKLYIYLRSYNSRNVKWFLAGFFVRCSDIYGILTVPLRAQIGLKDNQDSAEE